MFIISLLASASSAGVFKIGSFDRTGVLSWTNAFTNGVCTIEMSAKLGASWVPRQNLFTTSRVSQAKVALSAGNSFYRLLASDISTNSPRGYTNLLNSYGLLRTVAGNGFGSVDGSNYWRASFEGGYATNAALSRPHYTMADDAGSIFIVDKDSHSVLKVTLDGRIHTVAGTHVAGDNGDGPASATTLKLNAPNGLWVRGDGTFYILDTGNSKVRKVDTNGLMTTLFTVGSGVNVGRGLWVKEDESLSYFCSGTDLRKRVPGSITTLNNNFTELGNIAVNANGDLVATDRGANKVYLVDATGSNTGSRTKIFGNGSTNTVVDGTSALTNGLYGVRGVWLFPTGGYLLATHEGSQLLYVDPAGIIHILIDGEAGNYHAGDGEWFYGPGTPKIAELRSVTMDRQGNILIVENDAGYVREISFTRLAP